VNLEANIMTPQEAQALAGYLCQNLDQEHATTRKLLAAVPQEQLNFKLGEKGRTAAQLMWHLVRSEVWFGQGIAALKFEGWDAEGPPPATATEIVAAFDRDVPRLIKQVKSMTGEQLATPVNFMNMATLPAVILIGWWNHHTIHHRGQLSAYLRAMNAHVPATYGDSADEPLGTAAATA
jgi:uncharacterized damage-inducible protein DinB